MNTLEAALAEWRSALGEAHVVTAPEALSAAQTATFATSQTIPAILRPANTSEVQACLRIAQVREFVFTVKKEAQLWPLLDRLQQLALEGTLRNSFFIWNDVKALSVMQQFPFEATGGNTPLPGFLLEGFREEFGRWAVSGAISAQDGYWRKKESMPPEPHLDRDRCGFIWCSVAVPFTSQEARAACAIAARVPRTFTFEPNLALLAVSPRCLYLVAAIAYDRDAPGDDERALACYQALQAELVQAGYYPMRLGLPGFPEELPVQDDSRALLQRLKQAVDPAGILAPGRYGF